jgi:ferric-dicitrate binding protein FerR (iron transport regulator)
MNKRILEKFFSGEASEAEVQQVLKWFDADELNPQKVQSLEELWNQIDASDFVSHNTDHILRSIHQEIDRSEARYTTAEHNYRQADRRKWGRVWPWASAAAILMLVGMVAFQIAGDWGTGSEKGQITTIAEAGQKKTVTLTDGTEIRLNGGSRITVPAQFLTDKREVLLSGEAFIDVKRDTTRPFIVETEHITTTVLGTSFNIKSYDGDQQADVSLVSGKLKVQHDDTATSSTSFILTPGEAAVFDNRNNTFKKTHFDTKFRLGWIEGALAFDNANMDEIITRLERWYGVNIEVASYNKASSQEWNYRGVFNNESLHNVLKGISYVKDFTFEIEGQKVKMIF